jgi:hypothetical protein
VWMTESSTLTLPVSRSSVSSAKQLAHPSQVGFLAVLGVSGVQEQRTNGFIDGMQRVECAYYGPTTPAATGEKSLARTAPASAKGSGVPPHRGRPV